MFVVVEGRGVTGTTRPFCESGTTAVLLIVVVDSSGTVDMLDVVATCGNVGVAAVVIIGRTAVEVITVLFITIQGRCTTNRKGSVPDFCTIFVNCFRVVIRT